MKTTIVFLCGLFILSAECGAQENLAGPSRQLAVGVILPETGKYAPWGKEMRRGLELAIQHENSRRAV